MSYLDVLLHPTIVMATILYIIMAISFEIFYQNFLHKISAVSGSFWIAKHIGTPFFHILLLIAFIYMSYPVLYGLESHSMNGERILPSLTQVLNSKSGQTMKMINILFIISVLLPLIPVVNRFLALILPLQAMAGSAVLYGWLSQITGIEYSIFPGFKVMAMIVFFSFIAELLAKSIAAFLGVKLNTKYHTHDMGKVVHKSCLLIFQVPILLIYTLNITHPLFDS
ncbi:MAG: hypothetical protein KAI22_02400 [Gammaproteobacteria bacterium]|nr:hypothetical protein [Gammaproteobacteria bacterium]